MIDNELMCVCGGKLFHDFRPFTMEHSSFMVWTLKENLKQLKTSIPVAQCLACGRIQVPQATFPGKNILDAEVQLYAELLKAAERRNALISKTENIDTIVEMLHKKVESYGSIKATPVSTESTENAVTDPQGGSGPKRGNKK